MKLSALIPKLRMLSLQIRLALQRFGWGNSIACVLCLAGVVAWLWGIPHLHAETRAQQSAIASARLALPSADRAAPKAQLSSAQAKLANFYDSLGEPAYSEQQLKTLFAIANKAGLSLNQADYKLAFDKNSRVQTYQILLPVKGPYSAIRRFCEQTLVAIPFASLDEIGFKRETIGNATLEAKLRFTLYLADTDADNVTDNAHSERQAAASREDAP